MLANLTFGARFSTLSAVSLLIAQLAVVPAAHAADVVKIDAQMLCKQSQGGSWFEVGITEERGELEAYVVLNSMADASSKLIAKIEVHEVEAGTTHAYLDRAGDLGLFLRPDAKGVLAAKLMYIDPKGRHSLSDPGLACFPGAHLIYDAE